MQELKFSLQPKQLEFMRAIEKWPVVFYGGARGGGKSHSLREIMLMRRFRFPNSNGAIFRKSFPELQANHIRPLFRSFPFLRQYYVSTEKIITLPNGSTLRFCYCEGENDVEKYQGEEFHDLAIDEAGQWEETVFRTLHGSNRSADPNIKARCFLTWNPGGIGHGWLKRIFVEKRFKPEERESDYHFIQALVQDNKALIENDPDYIHRLNAEPNQALRKAYLYGDWDIAAGMFFTEIRRQVHLIKPFEIPHHWNRFGAYDFGFNHPGAFGWFATDEDGNVYLYREMIKPGLRIDQWAKELNKYPDTEKLYPIVAGHDCWAKKGVMNEQSPPTIAEEFQKHGIHLKRAVIHRIQGANQLRKYLAWEGKPNNQPKFFIFDTCPVSFDCISRMIIDPDRPEDVLKVDATEGDTMTGDDPYDMVRYGLMSRPYLSDSLPASHPIGSKEWTEKQVSDMEKAAEEYFKSQEEAEKGFGITNF